ncbi:MAG: anti-sigma factor, partial [Chloroflexi bacterium]|nr:anti-sigma factor [Chloroflexota bacterium]
MTRLSRLPPRDLEALSAYADGRLSAAERQALDARLGSDTELRTALDQIRATASLLRALPSVRPPR